MAVAEFQGQYFKNTDISKFATSCHRNVTVDKIVGGDQQSAGVEAELDIEYIKGVAPGVPLTVIYNAQYSLLSWANQITSMADVPLVHSVSYGNDEVQQTSTQYMMTCNTAFMKAGAAGISILFASGDQGVCGRSGCGLLTHARFHPDFPASSPYITAVGGTDFAVKGVIGEETTWADGGGGFSDTFDIPEWQKTAVAAYKASPDADLPPAKLWNNTGRGYPDVAALGGLVNPYCVATSGMFQGVAGTSASSPVVAGIFALLNGLRTSQNKAPLGFLNPFIYQNGAAFNDVTSGVNGGGRKYGFKAIKGWDAATGWGTPNYEALAKVVMQGSKSVTSIVV
jgi:tripeptidyl-peptidase-1